jgi:hypothetical protein
VDVDAAHPLPPGCDPGVADELLIALLVDDVELLRLGQRVRARGAQPEPSPLEQLRGGRAKSGERVDRLVDRAADIRVQLDDRRVQLGLQPPGELPALGVGEQLLDGRHRRHGLAVEEHHLFLDADRERRALAEVLLDLYRARRAPSVTECFAERTEPP